MEQHIDTPPRPNSSGGCSDAKLLFELEERLTPVKKYDNGWRWTPFFIGWCVATLFWSVLFSLFGGS
ncbi:MAG: hypothetical protein GY861_26140 [bacterium]|nr:hypothetical protein [bacterium]